MLVDASETQEVLIILTHDTGGVWKRLRLPSAAKDSHSLLEVFPVIQENAMVPDRDCKADWPFPSLTRTAPIKEHWFYMHKQYSTVQYCTIQYSTVQYST